MIGKGQRSGFEDGRLFWLGSWVADDARLVAIRPGLRKQSADLHRFERDNRTICAESDGVVVLGRVVPSCSNRDVELDPGRTVTTKRKHDTERDTRTVQTRLERIELLKDRTI